MTVGAACQLSMLRLRLKCSHGHHSTLPLTGPRNRSVFVMAMRSKQIPSLAGTSEWPNSESHSHKHEEKNCHDEVFDEKRSYYNSIVCVIDNKLITATLKQITKHGRSFNTANNSFVDRPSPSFATASESG